MTQRLDDKNTQVSLSGKGLKGRMLAATVLGLALTVGIGGWAAQAKLAGAPSSRRANSSSSARPNRSSMSMVVRSSRSR